MSNDNKLTNDLAAYFFGGMCIEDIVDDFVLFCCWKMACFEQLYQEYPFSNLTKHQRSALEEIGSTYFDHATGSSDSGTEQIKLNQEEIASKQRIQKINRKRRLSHLMIRHKKPTKLDLIK